MVLNLFQQYFKQKWNRFQGKKTQTLVLAKPRNSIFYWERIRCWRSSTASWRRRKKKKTRNKDEWSETEWIKLGGQQHRFYFCTYPQSCGAKPAASLSRQAVTREKGKPYSMQGSSQPQLLSLSKNEKKHRLTVSVCHSSSLTCRGYSDHPDAAWVTEGQRSDNPARPVLTVQVANSW